MATETPIPVPVFSPAKNFCCRVQLVPLRTNTLAWAAAFNLPITTTVSPSMASEVPNRPSAMPPKESVSLACCDQVPPFFTNT